MVKNGHKFLMFYVDHLDSYNGGRGKEWDDIVANSIAQSPHVSGPKKANLGHVEQSATDCSYVDDNNVSTGIELESNERPRVKLRPRGKKDDIDEDDCGTDDDSTDNDYEQNQQTERIVTHDQQHYEPEIIATLTQEIVSSQREPVAHGPLPENSFIQMHAMSQQPVVPTTVTNVENVHRKREVIALAKLKAAAERREVADQAKFDAAMTKLKEEEEKLSQAAEKRKAELLAKKIVAEERKKATLEEKRIAAEEKRKASEEKKKKAQEEKLAMAEKRRQSMAERKRNAEIEKQRKAEEKKRLVVEKRMIAHTSFQQEEANFLIHQAEEEERQQTWQKYLQTEEAARQQAWENQIHSQDTQKIADWEERKRIAEKVSLVKQQTMDENNEKKKAEDAAKVKAIDEQGSMKHWHRQKHQREHLPIKKGQVLKNQENHIPIEQNSRLVPTPPQHAQDSIPVGSRRSSPRRLPAGAEPASPSSPTRAWPSAPHPPLQPLPHAPALPLPGCSPDPGRLTLSPLLPPFVPSPSLQSRRPLLPLSNHSPSAATVRIDLSLFKLLKAEETVGGGRMDVKLKDLVPAATNTVNTTFIVVDKAARPTHANAHGREETCPLLVADETAAVHFLLWGTECDAFEPGDIVRLTSGIFSYHRGNNLFLRAGKRGRVEKVGEFTMMFVETPNMSEIQVLGKAYSYAWTILIQPSAFVSGIAGTSLFNSVSLMAYNVLYTSILVLTTVLDKDLSEKTVTQNPEILLYCQAGRLWNPSTFADWFGRSLSWSIYNSWRDATAERRCVGSRESVLPKTMLVASQKTSGYIYEVWAYICKPLLCAFHGVRYSDSAEAGSGSSEMNRKGGGLVSDMKLGLLGLVRTTIDGDFLLPPSCSCRLFSASHAGLLFAVYVGISGCSLYLESVQGEFYLIHGICAFRDKPAEIACTVEDSNVSRSVTELSGYILLLFDISISGEF
ncbi:hypothetical protein ZWY2020_043713 [Hordeum vulgare]|nr:hypothetical protein ZWY2020_043713 [Hordeum vulgare]